MKIVLELLFIMLMIKDMFFTVYSVYRYLENKYYTRWEYALATIVSLLSFIVNFVLGSIFIFG